MKRYSIWQWVCDNRSWSRNRHQRSCPTCCYCTIAKSVDSIEQVEPRVFLGVCELEHLVQENAMTGAIHSVARLDIFQCVLSLVQAAEFSEHTAPHHTHRRMSPRPLRKSNAYNGEACSCRPKRYSFEGDPLVASLACRIKKSQLGQAVAPEVDSRHLRVFNFTSIINPSIIPSPI